MNLLGVIFAVIIAGIAGLLFLLYRNLIRLRAETEADWAAVDNLLHQRLSVINELIQAAEAAGVRDQFALETTKEAVATCRSVKTPAQGVLAHNNLTISLRRLVAAAETTPELEPELKRLRIGERIGDVCGKLEQPIALYNNAATRYGNAIVSFPAVLFARRAGFSAPTLFRMHTAAPPVLCDNDGLSAAMSEQPLGWRRSDSGDFSPDKLYHPIFFWMFAMTDEAWDRDPIEPPVTRRKASGDLGQQHEESRQDGRAEQVAHNAQSTQDGCPEPNAQTEHSKRP